MAHQHQPPLKKPKRVHPWRNEYARDFGVRVLDRDASSGDVLAVECRFCAVFGREERVLEGDEKAGVVGPANDDNAQATPASADTSLDGETASGKCLHDTIVDTSSSNGITTSSSSSSSNKPPREKKSRARTRSIATWKKSFRSDNMRSHHLEQHPRKWREYQQLLIHVKKEQALHGFLLHPPVKGSDSENGDGDGVKGDRGEELMYSQQLNAFFGDPTSSASEFHTDPVIAGVFNHQRSTPSKRERKVPRAKSNITCSSSSISSTPADPALHQDQDTNVLSVADSSTAVLVLTEITSPAIVDELVPSLFDTTQREGEDHKAKKQVNGSSADYQNGSASSPASASASSSSVVELRPIYSSERATSTVQVSNGAEGISNTGGEGAAVPADRPVSKYGITLKSVDEYSYVRQLLTLGGSVTFDQMTKIVAISRAQFKLESRLPSSSQEDIREYAKLVVAMDLQMIADMMRGFWAYSLALLSSSEQSAPGNAEKDDLADSSAIEVRVRFPNSKSTDVENFHLLTVPYPSVQTPADRGFSSSDAAELITRTLSVLDPDWRKKLIGVCDEAPMRCMEVVSTVVDVIEDAASAPFYRVLRGADLVEASLLKALDGLLANTEKGTNVQASSVEFLESLDAVVQYLRGQQQWSKTHGICPKLRTNTRLSAPWLFLEALQWLVTRRELIGQLQSEVEPPREARLSAEWWVMCLALSDILSDYQSIYRALGNNNDNTDKPEQQDQRPPSPRAVLMQFVQAQTVKLGVSQVDQAHQVDNLEASEASLRLKRFRWTKDSIVAFFRSLNLSTRRLYSQLSPEEQANVVHQVGCFVLQSLNVINSCTSKSSSKAGDPSDVDAAAAEDAIPLTRPLDFVAIERGAVVDFIEHHSARLELSYDLAFIDGVSKEIKDLRDLVSANAKTKASLVEAHKKSFCEAWEPITGFSSTRALAAGFATAMPRSHELGSRPVRTSSSCSAPASSLQTEVQTHARQIEDVEKAYKLFQTGTASMPSL